MKVLIIKMSSLGDVIHLLPAVTDLYKHQPDVEITWVVEEAFRDLPVLHHAVYRVIPVAIRRWRTSWFKHRQEIVEFRRELQKEHYDVVIDAQGLLKSALVAGMARGKKHGFDGGSARERSSRFFYNYRYKVQKGNHAVNRLRDLLSQIFTYSLVGTDIDYGIARVNKEASTSNIGVAKRPTLFFLHGTTWESKHWPLILWQRLVVLSCDAGFDVIVSHGNEIEREAAEDIVDGAVGASVLAPSKLDELAIVIAGCAGVVAVDTGLGHLATALDIPTVGIYGPTNPVLTGPVGTKTATIVSDKLSCIPCLNKSCQYKSSDQYVEINPPCYEAITPDLVLAKLTKLISEA